MGDMSIVAPPFAEGFAGKVENGPSRTERLLGGLPRSFPVSGLPEEGHADDTAGPCRRRLGGLEDVGVADIGVIASSLVAWLS